VNTDWQARRPMSRSWLGTRAGLPVAQQHARQEDKPEGRREAGYEAERWVARAPVLRGMGDRAVFPGKPAAPPLRAAVIGRRVDLAPCRLVFVRNSSPDCTEGAVIRGAAWEEVSA